METFGDVEVLLRNAIHQRMKHARGDNLLRSWLVDPDLLDEEGLRRMDDVVARLKRDGYDLTEDRVVAGLSLGFWSRMLGKRHEELWRHTLRFAFPHGDGTRNQIAGYVNRIAQLRNRVAHHEALRPDAVRRRHDDALGLADAIDIDAGAWVAERSRVPTVLAARP